MHVINSRLQLRSADFKTSIFKQRIKENKTKTIIQEKNNGMETMLK